jgi:acetyl esterase/lipase
MDSKEFLESIHCREDGKWAHPDLESYFVVGEDSNAMFDESIPFEVRKAQAEEAKKLLPCGLDESRAEKVMVPGCPEEPDAAPIPTYIVKPLKTKKKMPCAFFIAPGGLTISSPEMFPLQADADKYGAVVVAFAYRTIFDENGSYPGAINDGHAAYKYVVDHADELGIDVNKIVIYGSSTGGHLGLALCHRLKKYGYKPRGCVVNIPVCDDRLIYGTSKLTGLGWVGSSMNGSCRTWLNGVTGDDVPAEAFANHATVEECIGLPPTFIHTVELDPCADPCMVYASKLMEAGVYTDIHVWGGSNHQALSTAGTMDPTNEYGQRYAKAFDEDVMDCIKYDLTRSFLQEEAE